MTRALAIAVAVAAAGCAAEAVEPELTHLVTGESASRSLVVDGDVLYWGGADGVRSLDLATGEIYAIGDDAVLSLAVAGDRVYWSGYSNVMSARTDGTDVRMESQVGCVLSMASDGDYVYWSSPVRSGISALDWTRGHLGTIGTEARISGLAAGDGRVYWSSNDRIVAAAPDGYDRVVLAKNREWPRSVAVSSDGVYWAGGGAIERADLDAGATEVVALTTDTPWYGDVLSADDRGVYWITRDAEDVVPAVYRAWAPDGGAEVLARDDKATAIATDGDTIYWANRDGDIFAFGPPR